MGGTFEVTGNEITFQAAVSSNEKLGEILGFLLFALPACLSSTLPDPVFLQGVDGWLGDTRIRIEYLESVTPLVALDDDRLAERVVAGLSAMDQATVPEHARLLAATGYVQTAARLLAAGYSPWEFMAEMLLNYSKALEVLFGNSRDSQRAGLKAVDIDAEDIETRFIPVTLLRDFLDVAHPKLAQLDGERLRGVYVFLVGLEHDFQRLLMATRNALTRGTFVFQPNGPPTLDPSELATVDRILFAEAKRRQATAEERRPNT